MGVEHFYIILLVLQNVNLLAAVVQEELVVGQGFHLSPSLHSLLASPLAAPIPSDVDTAPPEPGRRGEAEELGKYPPTHPPSTLPQVSTILAPELATKEGVREHLSLILAVSYSYYVPQFRTPSDQ